MTFTLDELDPFAPLQVRVKVFSILLSGPVEAEPERPRSPDQSPLATHPLASCADQRNDDAAPSATSAGEAEKLIVGGGVTSSTTESRIEPPPPLQLRL